MKKLTATMCLFILGMVFTHVTYACDDGKVPKTEFSQSFDVVSNYEFTANVVSYFSVDYNCEIIKSETVVTNNSFGFASIPIRLQKLLATKRYENTLTYQNPFVDTSYRWKLSNWYNS